MKILMESWRKYLDDERQLSQKVISSLTYPAIMVTVGFATIICVIACFEGINSTTGGAEGVGKATTSSVVRSFILIIIADCFFTALFYFIMAQ